MKLRPALLLLALTLSALGLHACEGYRLGGSKPAHLAAVREVHVAIVRNQTQVPRAAAHATNSIIDALTRDGTYRLATMERAEARLEAVLQTIDYRQARSTRTDTLRSEELEMTVTFRWTLLDAENPSRVLERGESKGTTRFFVDPNLQTARQTALIDALKRASESLVARLADGF